MNIRTLQYIIAFIAIALIQSCSGTTKIKSVETTSIEFNPNNSFIDSATYQLISPFKSEMDKIMNEVLVVSDTALTKELPESSLGNFVSDAVLKKANDHYIASDNLPANICLLNNGGLRAQLPKGIITRGNAFELMPFENSIVIITLSGEKTLQLFQSLVDFNGAPFSGATVKAKGKKIEELKINGELFDITKNYKVVTSDYLASGGDKYDFFKEPVKTETLNYKLRDAIIDYMMDTNKNGKTLNSKKDGRIKYE
jgi:2',3'-cyclic-nucleotide 2'-phosphodiesterase (5'-nucleotidase family)